MAWINRIGSIVLGLSHLNIILIDDNGGHNDDIDHKLRMEERTDFK